MPSLKYPKKLSVYAYSILVCDSGLIIISGLVCYFNNNLNNCLEKFI